MRTILLINLTLCFWLPHFAFCNDNFICYYSIADSHSIPDTACNFTMWKIPNDNYIQVGFLENQTVWCYVKINNITADNFFCIDNNQIDSLAVYLGDSIQGLYGDKVAATNITYGHICIPLSDKLIEKGFFLRFKKKNSFLKFRMSIQPITTVIEKSRREEVLFFVESGAYLLLFIGITIIFLIKKKPLYIYFLCSLLFGWCYVGISLGIFQSEIFGPSLYYSEFRFLAVIFWYFSLMIFLQQLLRVKSNFPKANFTLNKISQILLASFLILVFGVLFNKELAIKIAMLLIYTLILLTSVLFSVLCILYIKQKHKKRKIALFFILPHICWVILSVLSETISGSHHIHSLSFSWLHTYDTLFFGIILFEDYYVSAKKNIEKAKILNYERKQIFKISESAQLKERRNFANLLHDKFGNQLAHMGILAELDRYDDVKKELQILATQLRNFSHRVLPKSIDDGALISVLQEHMNWLNQENIGISFSLKTFDVPEKINPELALLIYLITLELISNAQKHGKATLIQMDIYAHETILSIHFFDNGQGFDVNKETFGFGLNQINTRILALNGSMEINSMINSGTEIFIQIPY